MHTLFIAVFFLVSFSGTLILGEQDNVRTKHLFVQRKKPLRGSALPNRVIYLSEDGGGSVQPSSEHSTSRRSRRSTRQTRSTKKDPTHTLHQFQDSHHMLIVQWSGFASSDTVVVLTRDIVPDSESTSYLYISNNYGVSYTNESNKLSYTDKNKVSKHGLIERYYSSPVKPKWYIFADITNNVLFISKDDCKSLKSVLLEFKPSDITFHDSKTNGILAYDDETRKIYYSKDFGTTWTKRAEDVRSYFWGIENLDSDDVIYLETDNKNGSSEIIRGHWDHKHHYIDPLLRNVTDFEINDVYLFATKKGKNDKLDLYVGYHYHDIRVAEFPSSDLERKEYYIADASEGQVFVAVNHNSNTSHLYISDTSGLKFTKSLDRILFYSPQRQTDHWLRRYITETFVDLYPVASMRGVYMASQLSRGKPGTRKIYTRISYDKGRAWDEVTVPERHANGSAINCPPGTCSLHLAQHYAQIHPRYWAPTIMSRESAPGLILSSGNIGERLSYDSNVYVSNDAGESWLEVLQGRWYYNFGDHGGVLVAVRQWSPTKELLYSVDEGLTWKRYNFTDKHIRVYGLLTEPGERTTTFTIFGSYRGYHSWLVVQVNVSNVLGRPCTDADYDTWTPYHRNHGYGCILGQRLEYERRKRNATCYNGQNYDRPINTSTCYCSGQDYECDVGYKPWRSWLYICLKDPKSSFDPLAPPRPCPWGTTYNVTQGYRKIAGDKCFGGFFSFWYEPYEKSCPFKVDDAFLLYAERSRIQYFDLTNSNHSTAVKGLKAAVAVAYDMRDDFIYWADMKEHKIMRVKFNSTDEPIFIAAIKQVEGLDFDWTTDNLYWVDSGEKVIEVCRKDGLFRKTIHSDDLDKPRALALDPHMGEMFWSDWGHTAKIEMSDMDGQNRQVLIKSGITWPNGLAVDIYRPETSRILYYTDAYEDIIGSYDLKAKKHKILASKSDHRLTWWQDILKHPYSITVDDKYVYWDDWQTGGVYKVPKSFAKKPITVIEKAPDFRAKSRYEIKVYYKRSQVDNSSCTNKKCSQLCLPKPKNKYNCACGDGLKLDPKTKKCKCLGGLITLKNGTCKRPTGKTCAPHEFSCNNGYCVALDLKCDWHDDCGDNSDEELDCDGTDGCGNGTFLCPKEDKCIPISYKCNNVTDCQDGFDEKSCDSEKCPSGEFRCKNKRCISAKGRCDGYRDCFDNSDEVGCQYLIHKACKKGQFKCDDKSKCVDGIKRCDGNADCQDNSDEINCVTVCPNVMDWFMCVDRSKCINKTLLCDGNFDCKFDHSDENCPCKKGQFKCDNKCVDIIKHCDGNADCQDNSDEINCGSSSREVSERQSSNSKKTLMWAIPVGIVFAVLLGALVYFVAKSRRMQRSFYRLVRRDSFDHGVTYNAGDEDDTPLIQGFSDDDPLVEA